MNLLKMITVITWQIPDVISSKAQLSIFSFSSKVFRLVLFLQIKDISVDMCWNGLYPKTFTTEEKINNYVLEIMISGK